VYAALVPLEQRGGLARFTLLSRDGGVVWSDDLPIGLLDNPTLRVHLEADREAVLVQTNDVYIPDAEVEVLPELIGWAGPPFELPPMALGPVTLDNKGTKDGTMDGREEVASLLPPILKGPLLLLLVLLLGGGMVLLARRPPALRAAGRVAPGGTRDVRPGPLDDDALVSLARELAGHGPVLLLPLPERRPRLAGHLLAHVVCMKTTQPDLPEVRRAAASLASLGRVCVLVDGTGALPAARAGEPADAVVRALLAGLPGDVAAVALLADAQPPPSSPPPSSSPPRGSAVSVGSPVSPPPSS
jgi:hypothetical protein